MESTTQQAPAPPCQCDQQLGGALPWLVAVGIGLLLFERWRSRRGKKREEGERGAEDGPEQGEKP